MRPRTNHPAAVTLGNLSKRAALRRRHGKRVNVQPAERQAATELAQLGGRARALALSPEQRRAIAKKAAQARWKPKHDNGE